MRAVGVVALVILGCGSDENTPDAPRGDARIDGPPTIDGPPMVDAVPSTVIVMPGACPGTPDFQLTTVGTAFREAGQDVDNPAITLAAGGTIEFNTTAGHNFASAAGTTPQFQFRSGPIGPQTACLTFTQATSNVIGYVCQAHASMNGSIDVN